MNTPEGGDLVEASIGDQRGQRRPGQVGAGRSAGIISTSAESRGSRSGPVRPGAVRLPIAPAAPSGFSSGQRFQPRTTGTGQSLPQRKSDAWRVPAAPRPRAVTRYRRSGKARRSVSWLGSGTCRKGVATAAPMQRGAKVHRGAFGRACPDARRAVLTAGRRDKRDWEAGISWYFPIAN